MTGALLAIDPSLRASGWALFSAGVLCGGGVVCTSAADATECAVIALARSLPIIRTDLAMVAEWPQVYTGQRGGNDPNDLLWLTCVLGAAIDRVRPPKLTLYRPAEWKGQVPKVTHNKRVLSRLTQAEMVLYESLAVPKGIRHNLIDAIGIGLKYLGRLEALHGDRELDPAFKTQRLGKGRGGP